MGETGAYPEGVRRLVILGRGAAGKSTLALALGQRTGLPVVELDKHFWRSGLVATPPEEWAAVQRELVPRPHWIMDGDLGPYDALAIRLGGADTVVLLDYSLPRCAWRVVRRSRERADFWRWVITYRWRSRPALLAAIGAHAPRAAVYIVRSPRALDRLLRTDALS